MRRLPLAAVLLAAAIPAHAGAVRAPRLTPGDSWTYANATERRGVVSHTTHDTATLLRADSRLIDVEVRPAGNPNPGPDHLFGPDWSRVRSVNGRQTVVNQPLSFPLTPGKSWTTSYAEDTPTDRRHTREQWHVVYTATGWDEVTVPAGSFRALRIEGDGTWTADLPSNVLTTIGRAPSGTNALTTRQAARVASGRVLKTFWYVPAVGRWVKSEEDLYDSNGVRSEHVTSELEAFTLAQPEAAEPGAAVPEAPAADAAPARAKHARIRHPAPPAPKPAAKPHPAAPTLPPLQETRGTVPGSIAG